jgi:hypothetical protein
MVITACFTEVNRVFEIVRVIKCRKQISANNYSHVATIKNIIANATYNLEFKPLSDKQVSD